MNELRFGIPMLVLHENGGLPSIRANFGCARVEHFLSWS